MKTLRIIFAVGVLSLSAYTSKAQVIEDTIRVEGVCKMCKERIEESASIKGVKYVSWDKATKNLSVAYNSKKTNLALIEESINKAGHSSENRQATKQDYEGLPDCCKYKHVEDH